MEDDDPNIKAYYKLLNNKKWFNENQDKWAAFVDGKLITVEDNEQKLDEYMNQRTEYKGKNCFSTLITKEIPRESVTFATKYIYPVTKTLAGLDF